VNLLVWHSALVRSWPSSHVNSARDFYLISSSQVKITNPAFKNPRSSESNQDKEIIDINVSRLKSSENTINVT